MTTKRRKFYGVCGFTLIEVLVSIVVVMTAATIFISLFGSTQALSRRNRGQLVAATLAEEQLNSILRNPSQYAWNLDGAEAGELVAVARHEAGNSNGSVAEDAVWHEFDGLTALPAEVGASRREEIFHARFRWRAYAMLPQPDARHVNVTVVVSWTEAERERLVALTSSAPRYALGGRPLAAARAALFGGQA